jgi:hypothetical protein
MTQFRPDAMSILQEEYEATGYASWLDSDLYPDGKMYTKGYTRWLEEQVLALRQPPVSGSLLLEKLRQRLDEALAKETPETLIKWLEEKRK